MRMLTHKLTFNPMTERWSCRCGYLLGRDGHEALYALCPLTPKAEPRRKPYHRHKRDTEFNITVGTTDLFKLE